MSSAEGSFDGGTGTDLDTGDNSSPVNTPDSGQSQEPAYNPAWEGVYGKLPQEFHNMIRPSLDTWDKNYQNLQSQYEPWKNLGQDYETVQRNLSLVQEMNANPQGFYERLGQLIGVTPNQAQNIVQGQEGQQNAGINPGTNPDDDYLIDPEVAQLKQTVAELQAQSQQWNEERQRVQREQEVSSYQQKADAHINRLAADHQKNYPTIPFIPAEVVQRVLLQTYQNPDQEPDIDRAYREFLDLATSVRSAPRPVNSAPNVINPNGGGMPPSDAVNMATATPDQRKKAVADFLASRNSA